MIGDLWKPVVDVFSGSFLPIRASAIWIAKLQLPRLMVTFFSLAVEPTVGAKSAMRTASRVMDLYTSPTVVARTDGTGEFDLHVRCLSAREDELAPFVKHYSASVRDE
ncbi:hypothetical protein SAMN05216202_3081 [Pseudomonas mucidolens]|uniref:Uncharacterized protein n=1 Tax=Pseudomonas mucidolens TaxID=46679 RepID=A0A1H2N5R6_9PSED|nr:hypothetical protein SAMN05216202_3081 [Pseudomonas mucidolens]SQH32560.1 Uncharacterised protein [Pseudomonas mucidolens]